MPKPHARVMETMRAVDKNGFGQKVLRLTGTAPRWSSAGANAGSRKPHGTRTDGWRTAPSDYSTVREASASRVYLCLSQIKSDILVMQPPRIGRRRIRPAL